MRSGADEAISPKYAHIERERRWLVDPTTRPDFSDAPYARIEDHYIQGTRMRLRRMTDNVSGECALKLTKKYEANDPLARPIVTTYLSNEEFELIASLPAQFLRKRRYKVMFAENEFCIDVFEGPLSGLELAEIECPDGVALRKIARPSWAICDVSETLAFQGGQLVSLDAVSLASLLNQQSRAEISNDPYVAP